MRTEGDVRPFEGRKDLTALRFGPYELDLKSGELWKSGSRVRAQHQPLKVLALLASRPGEVLSREEIQREIWPDGVFVDFEQSLNFCIRHIRGVLNDSAATPHYIETLPKRGYRWIAPVERVRREPTSLRPVVVEKPRDVVVEAPTSRPSPGRLAVLVPGAILLLLVGAGLALVVRRPPPLPIFHRLTFQRGSVSCARFTPDGQVVLAAHWDGEPEGSYAASETNPSWRRLDVGAIGWIAGALTSGEVAYTQKGSLFRSPLNGGPPKALAEHIWTADGTPDGATYVAARYFGPHSQIEWPLGHVVAEAKWPTHLRLSPKGDRIAFFEHPVLGDDRGYVVSVDRDGQRRQLTPEYGSAEGLAWSPKGDEVWFTAADSGLDSTLWAVSLSGRVRKLLSTMGRLVIQDVAPNGRVLLAKVTLRGEARFGRVGEEERDVSWLDLSSVVALSPAGDTLLFSETGEGGGSDYTAFIRSTAGGAVPVRLGHGSPTCLSPDGKWVATIPVRTPDHLELLPTGAGDVQVVRDSQISQYLDAAFMPDGRSLLVSAFVRDGARSYTRTFLQPLSGRARPMGPEGILMLEPGPSPDGKMFLGRSEKGIALYPLDGGPPRELEAKALHGSVVGWKDATTVYLNYTEGAQAHIDSLELLTGRRQKVRDFGPTDTAGVAGIFRVAVAPDGKSWAYSFVRVLGDLYTVDQLS
jgi:DNA-binding winged helix-turn-helix (wHTH) protein